MNTTPDSLSTKRPLILGSSVRLDRYYYTAATALLLILMLLGFQQFYLHGRAFPDRPLTPPIRSLLIVHGVGMTLWILLALVQPWLIASRRHRVHMRLGMAGAALAVVVFLSGFKLAIEAAQVAPPEARLWGLNLKQFMTIPVSAILLFGGFVAVGVFNRRKPAIHRPMMYLASLVVIAAAVDRISWITGLYNTTTFGAIMGPYTPVVIIGLILLLAKAVLSGAIDKPFTIGWIVIAVCGYAAMTLAPTAAWDSVANILFLF